MGSQRCQILVLEKFLKENDIEINSTENKSMEFERELTKVQRIKSMAIWQLSVKIVYIDGLLFQIIMKTFITK